MQSLRGGVPKSSMQRLNTFGRGYHKQSVLFAVDAGDMAAHDANQLDILEFEDFADAEHQHVGGLLSHIAHANGHADSSFGTNLSGTSSRCCQRLREYVAQRMISPRFAYTIKRENVLGTHRCNGSRRPGPRPERRGYPFAICTGCASCPSPGTKPL